MALQFIGIDPGTDGSDCPTVWVDDTTGDFVLKGWKITDPVMLARDRAGPSRGSDAVPGTDGAVLPGGGRCQQRSRRLRS